LVWWEEDPSLEKEIEILQAWGLTIPQAKVYLALIRLSTDTTAGKISSFSKMARTDVYRVLDELQEVGLIEKVIAAPTKFKAFPINKIILILTERRTKKTLELQLKAQELIRLLESRNPEETHEEGKFRIIPKAEALLLSVKEALNNAQKSIDLIFNWTAFPRAIYLVAEELEQALKRNVNIRCIVDKPEDAKWPETVQLFMKHKSFKLRALPNSPITRSGIYDRKKVFIASYLTPNAAGSKALMSTNPGLIKIVQCYFEETWEKATSKKDSQRNLPKKAKKRLVIYHTTQRQGKVEKMKTSGLISKY
jgi:sugar-specific transcriptional regulator TrmB